MGATAKFQRIGVAVRPLARAVLHAHRDNAHLLAVFLAEKRLRAQGAGIVRGHDPGVDGAVLTDEGIYLGLNLRQFRRRHAGGMAEVKPQTVRRVQAAFLRHMIAKRAAQRLVQKVRRRMVGANLRAAAVRHLELGRLAAQNGAFGHRGDMDEHARRLASVGDLGNTGLGADKALIAHLSATFGVERRLVHHDLYGCPSFSRPDFSPIAHQRVDLTLGCLQLIAQEFGGAMGLGQAEPNGGIRRATGPRPSGARLGLLLFHGGVKALHVHRTGLFAQHVLRQVQGEAVGVIKLKRHRTRQIGPVGQTVQLVIQQPQATVERGLEPGFLQLQRLFDQALGAGKLRIGPAHLPHQGGHQTVHHRILRTQHMRVPHSTSHDAAQHIAAAFVGRRDTVGDQERNRAQMVGDHPVAGLALAIRVGIRRMRRSLDQAAHQVGVIVVVLALQQRADPLQPHAGVDRLHLQGDQTPIGELLILHEHIVPDLDEPVAILLGAAGRAAPDAGAVVIENLGARATGASRPHAPEVVVRGDADDPLFGQARDFAPIARSLIVGVIDGDRQLVFRQTEILGQQLPSKGNSLFLEIVAKGKIPQHFKESVVTRGIADIVQIIVLAARAHAFLGGCGALVVAGFHAGETVLKLHHARVGKHQRRVVARHQRAGVHMPVPVADKEIGESRADVVQGRHGNPFGMRFRTRLAPPARPVHGLCAGKTKARASALAFDSLVKFWNQSSRTSSLSAMVKSRPLAARILSSISEATPGFCFRNILAFSRP